jgi:hypothetical protein
MIHWLPMTDSMQLPENRTLIVWHKKEPVVVLRVEDGNFLTLDREARTIKKEEVSYWTGANTPP